MQLLQNLEHDGDDESENGRSATDKPVKPKRDRAASNRKYNENKRQRDAVAARASDSKYRDNHSKEIRQRRDPVAARASAKKHRANHPELYSAEARREARRREYARFKPIRQQWDIDSPCRFCGKLWLKSSEAGLRKKCCQNGLLWRDETSAELALKPLPYELEKGFFSTHFVKSSNQYNNIPSVRRTDI